MRWFWVGALVLIACRADQPTIDASPLPASPGGDAGTATVAPPHGVAVAAECAGPPAGASVCPACPGADDRNSGTYACPLRTIAAGIAHAQALPGEPVRVASRWLATSLEYAEEVSVPAGVLLQGNCDVDEAGGWTCGDSRAEVKMIRFAPGTGTAAVRHFDASGISIVDASPVISDVHVRAAEAIGIEIRGTGSERPAPELTDVVVEAVTAADEADGIRVTHASPKIGKTTVHVQSATDAFGLRLIDAAGTEVSGSTFDVVSGRRCAGVHGSGDLGGVSLKQVTASGCSAPFSGGELIHTIGVWLDACTGGGAELVESDVSGGTVWQTVENTADAYGVLVGEGCTLRVDHTQVMGVRGQLASGSGPFSIVDGVQCFQSHCSVVDSTVTAVESVIGAGVITGISCGDGTCTELRRNVIKPGYGQVRQGVWLSGGAPQVSQNRIVQDAGCGDWTGIFVQDTRAAIFGNYLAAGECTSGTGLWVGFTAATAIESNTIVAPTSVRLSSIAMGMVGLSNNIFAGTVRQTGSPIPAVLANNDFWAGDGMPLYDRDGVTYASVAEINAGLGSANVSVDPLFTADPPHLSASSPCRGAGAALSSTAVDFDGDARPMPAGTNPDIGADEVP